MSCDGFEKFVLGEWPIEQFQTHMQECGECHTAFHKDKKLLDFGRSLKTNVETPYLWSRIQKELDRESTRVRTSDNYRQWIFRLAAIIFLAVGIGILVQMSNHKTESGLLAESALKKVESQEKEYEAAIKKLESFAVPQLSQLDQELMLLYRDRLETIDTQIEHCKEALAMNPANAHIRRYLLAALRDKKETLKEIMELS